MGGRHGVLLFPSSACCGSRWASITLMRAEWQLQLQQKPQRWPIVLSRASGQVARVPQGFACWEGRRKGLEKITCVSVLLSSGLQLGIWFCSRNFGSRPRSCYRTPNRSKGEALGIPIPGRDPGPAQPQRGPLSACSPACLSVSLTLRSRI